VLFEDSDTRPPHVLPRSLCCSPASISPGPSPFLTPSTAVYSCTAVPCLKVTAEPATATSCAFGPVAARDRASARMKKFVSTSPLPLALLHTAATIGLAARRATQDWAPRDTTVSKPYRFGSPRRGGMCLCVSIVAKLTRMICPARARRTRDHAQQKDLLTWDARKDLCRWTGRSRDLERESVDGCLWQSERLRPQTGARETRSTRCGQSLWQGQHTL